MNGYCYSVIESLLVRTPVIVTNCPVFKELGLVNGKNSWILDFDMQNVPINDIYKGLPKFKYEAKIDNWDKYLVKGKSTYKKEFTKLVKVKCIKRYYDIEAGEVRDINNAPYKTTKARADLLEDFGFVKAM